MRHLAVTLAVLTICVVTPASASPASSEPVVEGPLIRNGDKSCHSDTSEWVNGEIAVDTETCDWWFTYAPLAENDVERDHGVLWLQTTVDPRPGYCLDKVFVHSQAGEGFRSHSAVPNRGFEVEQTGDLVVRMTTDARGHGIQPASIMQDAVFHRGKLKVDGLTEDGWVRTRWTPRNSGRAPVTIPIGIEVSWDGDTVEQLLTLYGTASIISSRFTRC